MSKKKEEQRELFLTDLIGRLDAKRTHYQAVLGRPVPEDTNPGTLGYLFHDTARKDARVNMEALTTTIHEILKLA
jgi:hypothetical protein